MGVPSKPPGQITGLESRGQGAMEKGGQSCCSVGRPVPSSGMGDSQGGLRGKKKRKLPGIMVPQLALQKADDNKPNGSNPSSRTNSYPPYLLQPF